MQNNYSHGKLLLTGEYVILNGALGLGLPTKKGQSMHIETIDAPKLVWKSHDHYGNIWFEQEFNLTEDPILIINKEENHVSSMLLKIIGVAKKLNPEFLDGNNGYEVKTALEFPRNWGLGSSSTLINNFANWAKVDPFELLEKTFGGSGYDIACAQNEDPILYQLKKDGRIIQPIDFKPIFAKQLYFIHLNKKQDSREGIVKFRSKSTNVEAAVSKITAITKLMINCHSLINFEGLIRQHENIISGLIDTPTIKELKFKDYKGSIKSLGAWGGDFILATATYDPREYFFKRGYKTVIPFNDMVL
jgi:mevalonate kinase